MGLLSSSKSKTAASSAEQGQQGNNAPSANISINAGDDLRSANVSFLTDSAPALNLAGESVRAATNLATSVAEGSIATIESTHRGLSDFFRQQSVASERQTAALSSGLQSFAKQATADPGDQIAGLVKLAIGGGLVVAAIAFWRK